MERLLIFIFLNISFSCDAQHYYVIPTTVNAENKAKLISQKMYKLSRPNGTDSTKYLFGYIKHPTIDSFALQIDTAFIIPKGAINSVVINDLIAEVYPTITTAQRNAITSHINTSNSIRISRLIITSRLKLWTRNELQSRGWFVLN